MTAPDDLRPYLAHIARLFPGVGVRAIDHKPRGRRARGTLVPDAEVEITLQGRTVRLHAEVKRTHLATAVARALVGALGDRAPGWILFAPYIGRPLAALLVEHGLNYVDLHGNCHVRAGGRLAAHVEGRRPAKTADRPKGVRAAGVRALFALLAEPALLGTTGRQIARAANTTHPTALDAVRRLEEAGAVATAGRQRGWMPGGMRIAFERWMAEYETVLRPALMVGRYRTPDPTPPDLDRRITALAATEHGIRFGGAAAAFRIAPHHRGETTVVHLEGDAARILRPLRAVADPRGPLWVMGLPGPQAARGMTPDTAHPLLVYAEMLHAADDRTLEAAQEFRELTLGAYA